MGEIILRNLGPNQTFRGFVPADDPGAVAYVYNKTGHLALSNGRGGITALANPETTGQVMCFDVDSISNLKDAKLKPSYIQNLEENTRKLDISISFIVDYCF